ncbi:MAG TPA: histidine phosphatase family protein [Solirubrobacteraceae bacterium]|nr:histidine phosphatase family protein [Solirubrobacteraceae bacterium]
MARQLWLLRHADAEPHGTRPDAERRLTERGESQARLAGVALARMGVGFREVLTSPRERALRTAMVAGAAWSEQAGTDRSKTGQSLGKVEIHEPLSAGFDAQQALAAMAGLGTEGAEGRLLLVGHEPDLSNVVGELTGARVDLKKGGLAVVRMEGPSGELVLLLRPHELALIATE